jgi:hypothetical protein
VFDREGKILRKVGEPGNYGQANLSPDGARVVEMRNDPKDESGRYLDVRRRDREGVSDYQ